MNKPDLPPSPVKMQHDFVLIIRMKRPDDEFLIHAVSKDGKADVRYDAYVLDVGPGLHTDAVDHEGNTILRKPTVKRGDRVMVNPQSIQTFTLHGWEFAIVPNVHVFGVLDDEGHKWFEDNKIEEPKILPIHSVPKGPHRKN